MNFKIISKIQNLFDLEIGDIDEEINKDKIKKETWTILDPTQIIALTAKTKNAKKILSFFNIQLWNRPDISKLASKTGIATFNLEYLKDLLEIAFLDGKEKGGNKYVSFRIKDNSPIEIETENFLRYQAPFISDTNE